ncbi:MAG: PD-(D/E)XK nuclease family protein, partial [Gammaproteobacteria bacterium]
MDLGLFETLKTNVPLLTANQRLALFYQTQFAYSQQMKGAESWKTPIIQPFKEWCHAEWQIAVETGLLPYKRLLSSTEETIIWQQVISPTSKLINLQGAIELAQSAWNLLEQWEVDLNMINVSQKQDIKIFLSWAKAFEQVLQKNNFITSHGIFSALKNIKHKLTDKIMMTGFDEITPQHEKLLEHWKNLGTEIIDYFPKKQDSKITVNECNHAEEEMTQAANWAYHLSKKYPDARIGCVIPTLAESRKKVAQIFKKTFCIEDYLHKRSNPLPYNISAGLTLMDYPLSAIAFHILSLKISRVPTNILSVLLRTPFIIAAESELHERAVIDTKLHDLGMLETSLNHFKQLTHSNAKQLSQALKQFLACYKQLPKTAIPSAWINYFIQLLESFGWPGERPLNSTEYQIYQRMTLLFNEFAQHDQIHGLLNLSQAISQLKLLASKTIFQPQASQANVHVLGLLEAAGLPFDFLWIMGLHDGAFPKAPKPHPLLPLHLQRQLQMPHATAERELKFSKQLLERFKLSSSELIVSFPAFDEDRELRISPLLNDFFHKKEHYDPPQQFEEDLLAKAKMEYIHDDYGPAIENRKISGGTSIFKYQAQCPFKAFALFRLQTESLNLPEFGLSAIERGSMIHAVLDKLWKTIKSKTNLLSYNEIELKALIETTVSEIITPHLQPKAPKLFELEKIRLIDLIYNWIELEKNRDDFTVKATELKQKVAIGDLELHVQVDRIDEVGSKHLIIDYKTGVPSIQHWFGERPDEPQLPIYCIAHSTNAHGLAFAQINTEQLAFKGISEFDMGVPGIKLIPQINKSYDAVTWNIQVKDWEQSLTQ